MTASIIDGKALAEKLREQVAEHVALLKSNRDLTPALAVVLVGDDPASQVYVRSKGKYCREVGIESLEFKLNANVREDELVALIKRLNHDNHVNGILVQLPLSSHLDPATIINVIDPQKDVDGFHVTNAGRLATGQDSLVPCTPLGCLLLLLRHYDQDLSGLNAVVVGRSNIVGKPLAQLLLRENCSVTIVHSRTRDIEDITRRCDILVAALGRPQVVKENWVKPGATIIDVGINRIQQEDGKIKLVGDVDFDSVHHVADAITPVPGGVGPMTIACLLANTVRTCCIGNAINAPAWLMD